MDYAKIDKVINRYNTYLPMGNNFSESVYNLNFEYKEQLGILKYLEEESILEKWGDHGKHILTALGKEIVEIHGGIEQYLEHKKKEKEQAVRIEKIKREKLINDAKLSKWQVKTFWPVFIFGLLGGIYALFSIIDLAIGESEEQKIEHILERILQEREETNSTSTYPMQPDSVTMKKID